MKKFSLSLDDFSPKPGTNNLEWCFKIIEDHPGIKIDLFIPSAYARLNDVHPFYISGDPEWVKTVKFLPSNFGICLHGMYHRRKVDGPTKYHNSNNDEWEHLTYKEAEAKFYAMTKEFDRAGLKYKKVFRPPGWRLSRGSAKLLFDKGFTIAGDTKYYNILKDKVPNMQWISYNWDMTGPCKEKGDIVAYGHTSDWTNNYMNEERYKLLKDLLSKEQFDFRFIEEM